METLKLVLTIFHMTVSVALMIIVLMQQGKGNGLSSDFSGSGAETFFGRNKSRTFDSFLARITTAFAVIFIITSVCLAFF